MHSMMFAVSDQLFFDLIVLKMLFYAGQELNHIVVEIRCRPLTESSTFKKIARLCEEQICVMRCFVS